MNDITDSQSLKIRISGIHRRSPEVSEDSSEPSYKRIRFSMLAECEGEGEGKGEGEENGEGDGGGGSVGIEADDQDCTASTLKLVIGREKRRREILVRNPIPSTSSVAAVDEIIAGSRTRRQRGNEEVPVVAVSPHRTSSRHCTGTEST